MYVFGFACKRKAYTRDIKIRSYFYFIFWIKEGRRPKRLLQKSEIVYISFYAKCENGAILKSKEDS